MSDVLRVLERYAREEVSQLAEHPLVGRPTLSVGTIQGGISVNTVPDLCTIEIDRRIVPVPSESPLAAQQHVIDYLQQHLPATIRLEHQTATIHSPGLTDQRNKALAQQLSNVAREHAAPGEIIGVPYGTDAPAYDVTGVPTVVFGPGSIAQAHTCDEWIAIEQLQAASESYYQFALAFANA
jgi:acetylornithine deacetylase